MKNKLSIPGFWHYLHLANICILAHIVASGPVSMLFLGMCVAFCVGAIVTFYNDRKSP